MNTLTETQLETIRTEWDNKTTTKTKLCTRFGISYYELQKVLGCGYKKRNGKRGRKKGWRKIPIIVDEVDGKTVLFQKIPAPAPEPTVIYRKGGLGSCFH